LLYSFSVLKEEALGYKKQLDEATNELQGFKNIGINPMDDINDIIHSTTDTLTDIDSDSSSKVVTQVEQKRETVTFEKKKKSDKKSSKGGES